MHLRRALLLFVIVIGMAALAASVAQPGDEDEGPAETAPTPSGGVPRAEPGPGSRGPAQVRFSAARGPAVRHLTAGRSAVVTVTVSAPGQVELEGLGATSPAEPLTPARFDVYAAEPGRHAVLFTPAAAQQPRRIGTLVVEGPRQASTSSRSRSTGSARGSSSSSSEAR